MFELTRTHRLVLLGVAVPPTAYLLYWLIKSSRDDEEEEIDSRKKSNSATSRQTVIELPIPRKAVGGIIGRHGAMIKELQEQSGARMNFKDDTDKDEQDRIMIIRGTLETAQAAECMIRKILADLPVIIEEVIHVPQYALGRIIGRGGESVRGISSSSNAKVFIDRVRSNHNDEPRPITINGTRAQIDIAKDLIQEKIQNEEEFRAKAAVAAANRETRKPNNIQSHQKPDGPVAITTEGVRQLTFPKEKDFVEVFVSAIANPEHFWVQIIGSMALQLDQLSENMTRYYAVTNKDLMLSGVKKGDIVAAPFENDKTWYRAKVMDVTDTKVDVFYVDYGDSAYLDIDNIRLLSSDYLQLPFQAIECRLDGIKPLTEGQWGDDVFDVFERLAYCAKWRVLIAKLVKWVNNYPSIRLIDTNGEQDIDIGEELVRQLDLERETETLAIKTPDTV